MFPVSDVEEELVLQDDFCFEAPETFTTNREKIINDSSDSEGETKSKFPSPQQLTFPKRISNKQMLTEMPTLLMSFKNAQETISRQNGL